MSQALNVIEKRVTELQQYCQDRTNFLNQVNVNIKQLRNERKLVLKQLSEVQGAIQGFAEAAKLVKGDMAAPSCAVLDSAPVEVAAEAPVETVVEPEVAN